SEEELQRLVSRTEGWIAGLHLVALTMQKREDRTAYLETLTGSQRYLLDYVQEDLLARLAPDTRDFLLHTAILSRLDAAVCQAVTAAPTRAASQHMLALLERANLFLVPLDEERRTYRLHDLFREALLSALHTSQPEMVSLLHRRAADFYEAEGQWAEAITHALAAADFSTAARLMEQTVEQFWVHGEAATMARWVLALPDPLVREHARLALTTPLYLLHPVTHSTREQRESRHQQVRQLMARVEAALQHQANETNQEILATRAGSAFRSIDLEAREALEALLHRRLRLLRAGMALYEAIVASEYERLRALHQELQELDVEEARGRLRTVIGDAATWQQSDLLLAGYIRLMQVELARGDLSAVQQALQEFEQLKGYQGYRHWSWLPIMRAQWWLAQGQMKEAAGWAMSIVFPEGAWERSLYDAFPVVMRVYFAELRWTEALELLDRFSGGLDRSANIMITLTYLAQYMVALHHAGQNEQSHEVSALLVALC